MRDNGLTHALLNIQDYNTLLGHPVVGGSREGFVIENIMAVISSRVQPYYYSTSRGEEIDLVLDFASAVNGQLKSSVVHRHMYRKVFTQDVRYKSR